MSIKPLSYVAEGRDEDRWQYNQATERVTDFGLGWDWTSFRPYDAVLGRFWGVDAMADLFPGISSYSWRNRSKLPP
jgi:hypothetical protein